MSYFRFRIRTVLAVLYWLRLEKGTENTLLNKAFNTMKQENHPWLQNIQYSLWQVGLGNIWFNPKTCKKNSLKLLLTTRLKDIYSTDFRHILPQQYKFREM